MTATLPNVYVPDFALTLNGQPAPTELRAAVTSLSFEEALEGADRVEVALANPGLRFLDHPLLQLGVQLELALGYRPAALPAAFIGDITGVEPSFPSSGMPVIVVSAHDFLQRLAKGTKERSFPYYLPDSVIAAIVAAENFLLADPDPAAAALSAVNILNQRPRSQFKKSDYDFLREIAAEYGFDMWVEGHVFHFRLLLRGQPPPEVELRWGASLLDFTPKHSSIGEIAGVSIKVWIEATKTQFAVSVSWDGDRLTLRVQPAFLAGDTGAQATLSLPDIPLDTPADAIKWVVGEMRRRINTRITGSGSTVGDPRLRAGRVIMLSGLGHQFSGSNYRLTSVTHTLDAGGYRTRFQVRQELV
jgi:phage protein D